MIIELVYVTVHYRCGCSYARPVQPPHNARETYCWRPCKVCQAQFDRQQELKKEAVTYPDASNARYYLVDGHRMSVYQRNDGYWFARRTENGKNVKKYFGRSDPRPLLEVAS